jgi:hypothetical protein
MRLETTTLDTKAGTILRRTAPGSLSAGERARSIFASLVVVQLDEFSCVLEFHLQLSDDGQALIVEQE